ncbi:DUF1489 family protein [Sandaracinobacteroides saxicola]|uniref:DUF1489 family protein n=1 Tax=Sandaracinobacteroides saxicola TaxID=2759707 RepID=A0A7G5IHM9_9SPHN|nr:DUF1489 family protein [Sandaracinobacteroides saxicola]QMW22871.1 DUF1489 family protein [Sandaracinobacteroides saxicola]
MLHMSRVAFGCTEWTEIAERQAQFAGRGPDGAVILTTRNGPTRAAEMAGGSLFWIIKHRIVARQALVGFRPLDGATAILLHPPVIPTLASARRSHQGWRYLTPEDAPPDLADAGDAAALPPELAAKLGALDLI